MSEAELDDETTTVTVSGSLPGLRDSRHGAPVERRAQLAAGSEPNGWFAGPHADPDRFELLGPGLAGGEGNTWRARYRGELSAPLTVAVKELRRPAGAAALPWPSPADLRRWEDQRALLQYMRIDHLVTMIDIFIGPPPHLPGPARRTAPDTPYVVMEWVPGPTLADELSGEPARAATLDERLTHVQHVAEALHSLHSRTVSAGNPTLHRDVKPTNCILDPKRGVVLVDVGTMRRMDDGYDDAGLHTPAYTAPEVLANPRAARAASSDLYALGALAYFCLLGEDPPVAAVDHDVQDDQDDQDDRDDRDDRDVLGEQDEQIEGRLLAAARTASVADPQGFVDHLRLMLRADPQLRPADAMSWARRLRSLAALRRHRRPTRFQAAVTAGAALVMLAGVLTFAAVRAGGIGSLAEELALKSREPAAFSAARPPPGNRPGPPPGAGPSPGTGPSPGGGPAGGPPPGSGVVPALGAKPGADGAVHTSVAAISTPGNGAQVPRCIIVSGTSRLPAGQTLVLAVENLSAGDFVRHLRPVDGWQNPSTLGRWHGRHFVGLPGEPAGGHYRIEALMVPLATLQKQINDAAGSGLHWDLTVPVGSVVQASVMVNRTAVDESPACGPEAA